MTRRFSFISDTCNLARVRNEVRKFFAGCRLSEEEAEAMVLAIDEACTNVIRHAYRGACRPIRLTLHQKPDGSLLVALRDYGKPCDPKKIRGRALADFKPGGVGVHIIRRAFDEVTYLPRACGTRLILKKYPSSASTGPSRSRPV